MIIDLLSISLEIVSHRFFLFDVEIAVIPCKLLFTIVIRIRLFFQQNTLTMLFISFSGYMKLEHGTTTRIVVAHPTGSIGNIGKIRRVELSWVYDMDVLQPRSLCFFWCNDRLYVNSVSVDAMDLPGRG